MRPKARLVGQLRGDELREVRLRGSVNDLDALGDANLLTLHHATGSGLSFAGLDLLSLTFEGGCTLTDCDFSGARFENVVFGEATTVFRRCRFIDTRFPTEWMIGPARFEECVFRGTLRNWFSHAGEFVDCSFEGRLRNCSFFGRPSGGWEAELRKERSINEFVGNDFTGSSFSDCAFRAGIDPDLQRLPDGVLVIRDFPAVDRAFQELIERAEHVALQRSLRGECETLRLFYGEGQSKLLLNPDDLPPMPPSTLQALLGSVA